MSGYDEYSTLKQARLDSEIGLKAGEPVVYSHGMALAKATAEEARVKVVEKPMTLDAFVMSLTLVLDMPPESSYKEVMARVVELAAKR